ncbi:MAG: MMPL family transporter [Actinomycetota bacterium]
MSLTSALYRIGRASARRAWWVIAAWVLIAGAIFAAGRVVGPSFVDDFRVPGAESQKAMDELKAGFAQRAGVTATVVFHARRGTLAEPKALATIQSTLMRVTALAHVASVDDPTRSGGMAGVSADRRTAFTTVHYEGTLSELGRPAADALAEAVAPARSSDLQVETGGPLVRYTHLPEPRGSEVVGLTAAIVVLFIAFGSAVAMGLPIVTALLGLGASLAIVWLLSHLGQVPTLTPTLATMLGLGVGIDYALFIVTRHREGLARGLTVDEAAGRAIATSGQAVLFAGGTVVVAIWGLWMSGMPFIGLIGTFSSIAVAVAVLAALTLLPALLGVVDHTIDRFGLRSLRRGAHPDAQGIWGRWAETVARHPWRSLVARLLVMGTLMVPLFAMRLGFEVGVAGSDSTQVRASRLIARAFGPGMNGPLLVVLEQPTDAGTTPATAAAVAVAADPDVLTVLPPDVSADGRLAVLTVIPRSGPSSPSSGDLVTRLRQNVLPPVERQTATTALVGGETAILIDLASRVERRLLPLIATVVGLSFILLLLLFRSVLVPLKAAILNGLSICAAYGAVVAVFEWGWGAPAIGLASTVRIVSFVPMVMFAILFGLSMDYEVFLLSRIREEYLVDRDTVQSVSTGIRVSARVITSAALVMIAVFLSFLLNESVSVKMIGFGLAVAVLVDATVVRIVLLPATMVLLGDANWWLPRWLGRVLPHLEIEGERALRPVEPRGEPVPASRSQTPAERRDDALR